MLPDSIPLLQFLTTTLYSLDRAGLLPFIFYLADSATSMYCTVSNCTVSKLLGNQVGGTSVGLTRKSLTLKPDFQKLTYIWSIVNHRNSLAY